MINSVSGIRSTGRICTDIADGLMGKGYKVSIVYGRESVPSAYESISHKFGNKFELYSHVAISRSLDLHGYGSIIGTKKIIRYIKDFKPDIIHLHNLHGYYINVFKLFEYLKTYEGKILWTLHDSWAFTGHCACFTYSNCYEWKKGCRECKHKTTYPSCSGLSNSEKNILLKKEAFSHVKNLRIVTPSIWLASMVKDSFLGHYPISVIHNGINTEIFRRRENTIKETYGIEGKVLILGVASYWGKARGIETFKKLATELGEGYSVMMVGVNQKQKESLPPNIICIPRTNSAEELAEIYSGADIFVNATLDDNYPTVNLEAISCGTPVITYDTGGSGESASIFGYVVERGNYRELINTIKNFEQPKMKSHDFSYQNMVNEYLRLY